MEISNISGLIIYIRITLELGKLGEAIVIASTMVFTCEQRKQPEDFYFYLKTFLEEFAAKITQSMDLVLRLEAWEKGLDLKTGNCCCYVPHDENFFPLFQFSPFSYHNWHMLRNCGPQLYRTLGKENLA